MDGVDLFLLEMALVSGCCVKLHWRIDYCSILAVNAENTFVMIYVKMEH